MEIRSDRVLRAVVRSVGLVLAVVSVVAIAFFGPWDAPGNLGAGSWLALSGAGCALLAAAIDLFAPVKARFGDDTAVRPKGDQHVLSTLRE